MLFGCEQGTPSRHVARFEQHPYHSKGQTRPQVYEWAKAQSSGLSMKASEGSMRVLRTTKI